MELAFDEMRQEWGERWIRDDAKISNWGMEKCWLFLTVDEKLRSRTKTGKEEGGEQSGWHTEVPVLRLEILK